MALQNYAMNVRILLTLFIICFPQQDEGRDRSVLLSLGAAGWGSVPGWVDAQ